MKQNPCPYETCVDHKKNDCDSHQIEACVKLRKKYNFELIPIFGGDCTMKQYIGTKVIQAEPCMRWDEEGYNVVYSDGYESWSPKRVFEEAYRPMVGMTFGQAIEAAKAGHKIARSGWNGKNQYIELASCIRYKDPNGAVVNAQHDAIGNRAFAFCGTSGVQLGWLASQADMLAEDWEIAK